MPYNLYFTRANGREVRALNSPYDTREATMRTVRIMTDQTTFPGPKDEFAPEFARQAATAPLGAVVTHPGIGISFRTEWA